MWVSWCTYFSLHQMPLILKVQCLIAAEGFDWLYLVFFHIDPLLFWRWFIYFFLCVLWAYLGIQKFILQYGKKGWRKCHSFPWWNFQQIPRWLGKVQRWVSGVCGIRRLPSLHLLAWLETGSYSFLFLNSLLKNAVLNELKLFTKLN